MLKTIVSIRYWNIQHPFSTIPSSFILKNHVHLFLMLMNLINIFSAFREIFFKVVFIFISLYMYIYVSVFPMCGDARQKSEESIRSPGAGVRGNCKPLDVDARNHTQILWKISKHL